MSLRGVSFRGKHNASKSKSFLVLLESQIDGNNQGLTARQLSEYTGVSLPSLKSLLTRNHHWVYVLYHPGFFAGYYALSSKGRQWLKAHYCEMPLNQYELELPVDITNALEWLQED